MLGKQRLTVSPNYLSEPMQYETHRLNGQNGIGHSNAVPLQVVHGRSSRLCNMVPQTVGTRPQAT